MSIGMSREVFSPSSSLSLLLVLATLGLGCAAPEPLPEELRIRYDRFPSDYSVSVPFSVTVEDDGSMTIESYPEMEEKGERIEDRISRDELQSLWGRIEGMGFFEMQASYETEEDGCREVWADHGSARIRVQTRSREHSVRHYLGCRGGGVIEDLWNLEERIEILAEIPERRQAWEIEAAAEAQREERREGEVIPVN